MQRLNVLRGSPEEHGENLGSQELREHFSDSSTPPELGSEAVDHGEGWIHVGPVSRVRAVFTSLFLCLACAVQWMGNMRQSLQHPLTNCPRL